MRKVVNPRVVPFSEIRNRRLPKIIPGNVRVGFHIFSIHRRTWNQMYKQKDQNAYYKVEKI